MRLSYLGFPFHSCHRDAQEKDDCDGANNSDIVHFIGHEGICTLWVYKDLINRKTLNLWLIYVGCNSLNEARGMVSIPVQFHHITYIHYIQTWVCVCVFIHVHMCKRAWLISYHKFVSLNGRISVQSFSTTIWGGSSIMTPKPQAHDQGNRSYTLCKSLGYDVQLLVFPYIFNFFYMLPEACPVLSIQLT